MTLYAYDAAFSSPAKVKAAVAKGAVAMNYYLVGDHAQTSTKPAAARAAGMGSILTYELGASQLVGASAKDGETIGKVILAAIEAEGTPGDGTVAAYPSVDVEVSKADITACDAAFTGLHNVLSGPLSLRVYGEGALIDHLASKNLIDGPCWLSASKSYPGYNVADENVCMVQEMSTDITGTDRNLVTNVWELDAWWPDNSPYADPLEAVMALMYPNKAAFQADLRAQAAAGVRAELAAIAAEIFTGYKIASKNNGVESAVAQFLQATDRRTYQLVNAIQALASATSPAAQQAVTHALTELATSDREQEN